MYLLITLYFFVCNCIVFMFKLVGCTGCPTTYITRHFFDNSKTNKYIEAKFEQEYVRCVRNEVECVCSVCLFCFNIFIGFTIIKEMPGLVVVGHPVYWLHTVLKFESVT
jgi:hypothetical protein